MEMNKQALVIQAATRVAIRIVLVLEGWRRRSLSIGVQVLEIYGVLIEEFE